MGARKGSTTKSPKGPSKARARAKAASAETVAFPIIGIGASAGGLDAIDLFLKSMPPDAGVAIVVVQHLDPTQETLLAELLQRATTMQVEEVRDRTPVQPNRVYVIPPNRDLSILHGTLHLLTPSEPRGQRLPIDFFFRSLADDAHEHGIGVILSGMGSDGTLGARYLRGQGGGVFVQEPSTAKFDAMPRSAVDSGATDVVAPVEKLPASILAYLKHLPLPSGSKAVDVEQAPGSLDKVLLLLRTHTGHDFSLYKGTTIKRRIERRMGIHEITRLSGYVRYLQQNPAELGLLFRELLIGVTAFFRDPEVWQELSSGMIRTLLDGRSLDQPVRVWVPGCSTGEEAYSVAMLFREAMDSLPRTERHQVQVFATDLNDDAIAFARAGVYPSGIAADVSPKRLEQFFDPVDHGFRVSPRIREMVIFAQQNVVRDPPFTRLDLISCRNLLIYLTPALQKPLLAVFHYSLVPGGFLLLGSSESVGGLTTHFKAERGAARLYRKIEGPAHALPSRFPSVHPSLNAQARADATTLPSATLQEAAEAVLLAHHTPPAVLFNPAGDILFINGRTGPYLEPPAGKANWNVYAMARPGLRGELASAARSAQRGSERILRPGLIVKADGQDRTVDLSVEMLTEPRVLHGLLLAVLHDAGPPRTAPPVRGRRRATAEARGELERDLEASRTELASLREEMRSAQQDASSAYEEVQSAYEEIQSTNEELTTSKEETQSTNEELQTINHELQAKLDDVSRLNNDLRNLLDNTQITSVFLDKQLRVRLFTAGSSRILRLIPGDVGRPITDIASDLVYPEFAADARAVLRTGVPQVRALFTLEGQPYEVRVVPYRTHLGTIDGVVLTYHALPEQTPR
jgi:two-component system CheB/CheR fusion protein